MNVRVAYDARSLEPQARHAGVGVVITNIRDRLGSEFSLQAISHNFEGAQEMGVRTWPVVPKMNNIMFECSSLLCSDADLYWATNTYIPMFLRKTAVATVHDLLLLKYPGDERNGRILADRFISSIKRARVIISDSVTTANDLMQVFPQCKRKIEVGLLGYDAPALEGERVVESTREPYAVMLGAHRPRKNLGLAANAVRALRDSGHRLRLLVTGRIDPIFRQFLTNCDFIEPVGVIPKPDIFKLLRGALALLFPSYYEGFGLPLLEAMACACPVVCLDTPINREVSGMAGRLLADDPRIWADNLKELKSSAQLRTELIGAGKENLRRFDWGRTARTYTEVFNSVLENC